MIEIEHEKVTEPGQNHEVPHTATHCNTLHHAVTHFLDGRMIEIERDKVTEPGNTL